MTLDYKLGPLELCFTPDSKPDVAASIFTAKYGYSPEYSKIGLGLLRLGPVYTVKSASSDTLQQSDVILHAGKWYTVALVDDGQVLTESEELLTVPDRVIIRSRE